MADLKFSPEEDSLLVTLIEENKALYDPECESHKDIGIREKCWSTIGKYLNKSDEECKKRWKHIRDSYNRCKRKRKNGLIARSKNSRWEFYKRLAFLEKVPLEDIEGNVNETSDSENISSPFIYFSLPQSTSSDQQFEEDNDQENEDTKPLANPISPTSALQVTLETGGHKKRKYDDYVGVMKHREENRHKYMKEITHTRADDDDDDDLTFGNHVKTVLKKLAPRLKIMAKKELFDILTKYETLNLDAKERRT